MEVSLVRADISHAGEIHAMQIEAFRGLLEKYQDFTTNPGAESVENLVFFKNREDILCAMRI